MARTIEAGEAFARKPARHDLDRRPVELPVRAIDMPGELLQLSPQRRIGADFRTRQRRDLQEAHRAAAIGIVLEKVLEGSEALRDAFRIVQPVDADNEFPLMQSGT